PAGQGGVYPMAKSTKIDPAMSASPQAAAEVPARYQEAPQPATSPKASARETGLSVPRRYTSPRQTAEKTLDAVEWVKRPAKISGADGEVVFKMDDAEVPSDWSQLATDVAVSKYFR